MGKLSWIICRFKGGVRDPGAKKCEYPLEAGQGKGINSPLKIPEKSIALSISWF